MIIVGTQDDEKQLLIRHKKDPIDRVRTIKLPNHIEYSEAEFFDYEGNLFIKTRESLLFVYRGSSEAAWIVDGEILVLSPTGAIYRTDGNIWQADWSLSN